MKPNDYYTLVYPYATKVEEALGIPAELIVAWWSWETAFGTNGTHKVNNEAGITKGSSGKDFISGGYAGYHSRDRFVRDYIRILSFSNYGYPEVRAAARANPNDYATITKTHNKSSWSEADYDVTTIVQRANTVRALMKGW